MAKVKPVPEGYHNVDTLPDRQTARRGLWTSTSESSARPSACGWPGPNGKIGHAEISIGDSVDHARRRAPGDGRARAEARSAARP